MRGRHCLLRGSGRIQQALDPRLRPVRFHPDKIGGLMAKPCVLALGIAAGIGLAFLDGLSKRAFTAQGGYQTGHAMGAHHRQGRIKREAGQRLDLLQSALLHHHIEPRINAGAQHFAVWFQKHRQRTGRIDHRPVTRALKRADRAARGLEHFHGADDPLRIGRVQARGGFGVAFLQAGMQGNDTDLGLQSANGGAHPVGHGGNIGQTFGQRAEIHARAACHNRQLALCLYPANGGCGIGEPMGDRIGLIGPDMAEQRMGNFGLLLHSRTGCQDAQRLIDLHGIRIDHHAIQLFSQMDGESGLAACRRSCDEKGLHSALHYLAPARLIKRELKKKTCSMPVTVATLVANPLTPCLSDALIKQAAQVLPADAGQKILDQGIAADLLFESTDSADHGTLAQTIREALGQAPVDVIVQPAQNRRKQLFLADMDSTMIGQECIDELADFVGLKAKVSDITERAMRGELDFEPALRERVALLEGLDLDVIEQILQSRITYTAGGRALVMTMKTHGAYTALVSGGFTLFTGPVSQHLGFHEHRSNSLTIHAGKLAGMVDDPILGKEAKRASLIALRDARGLHPSLTMAVGDGANDLAMLGEAGLGVAFYAKPAVAAAAHARINHADLSALLYAQGYCKADFVGL